MGLYQKCFVFVAVCLILSVPSSNGALADDLTRDQIVRWLDGQYSNEQQVRDGDLDAESNLLFPVFKRVEIPAFGTHVIYLQWPIGAPGGRLQRQRIWVFEQAGPDDGDGLRMNFYTLKEPERWRDAHLDQAKVRDMTADDTIGYPDSCLLPVTFSGGQIHAAIPETCEIVSQGTRTTMTLQSAITIAPNQITYREGGVRPDGSVVFQVPPQGRYVFNRVED